MKKLVVIDGNSLLFRAYYATSFTGNIMRRKDGFPTNAIFGFSNMINKIISSLKDDDLLFVSFDTGKKTFRHQEMETYKAQRKPIDEDLKFFYYKGLNEWHDEKGFLIETCLSAQDKYKKHLHYFKIKY